MPNNSSKRAVAATFALLMSVGTAGELLQPKAAQAISPNQQAQAIRAIRAAGCGLEFQGLSARITCSTQAIARLVQPQLNNSSLKLYNSRGKSYARFKIGSTSEQIFELPWLVQVAEEGFKPSTCSCPAVTVVVPEKLLFSEVS